MEENVPVKPETEIENSQVTVQDGTAKEKEWKWSSYPGTYWWWWMSGKAIISDQFPQKVTFQALVS